jgi:Mg2+ and Co2+ transporter CorA
MSEFNVIDRKINELNNTLGNLTSYLVSNDDYDHDKIKGDSYDVNKAILKLKLRLELMQIKYRDNSEIQQKINHYGTRTKFFTDTIKNIDDFNNIKDIRAQTKSMRILTTINMVALPLAVITGYFGMNFKSMGNPTHSKGILASLHGQKLVFVLFVISTIVMIIVANNLLT